MKSKDEEETGELGGAGGYSKESKGVMTNVVQMMIQLDVCRPHTRPNEREKMTPERRAYNTRGKRERSPNACANPIISDQNVTYDVLNSVFGVTLLLALILPLMFVSCFCQVALR